MGDVAIPDLRHFLYKSRSTAQCTCPEYEAPYAAADEQQRVRGLYQYLHQRIHSNTNPLKILFHVGQYETLLGWVSDDVRLALAVMIFVVYPSTSFNPLSPHDALKHHFIFL